MEHGKKTEKKRPASSSLAGTPSKTRHLTGVTSEARRLDEWVAVRFKWVRGSQINITIPLDSWNPKQSDVAYQTLKTSSVPIPTESNPTSVSGPQLLFSNQNDFDTFFAILEKSEAGVACEARFAYDPNAETDGARPITDTIEVRRCSNVKEHKRNKDARRVRLASSSANMPTKQAGKSSYTKGSPPAASASQPDSLFAIGGPQASSSTNSKILHQADETSKSGRADKWLALHFTWEGQDKVRITMPLDHWNPDQSKEADETLLPSSVPMPTEKTPTIIAESQLSFPNQDIFNSFYEALNEPDWGISSSKYFEARFGYHPTKDEISSETMPIENTILVRPSTDIHKAIENQRTRLASSFFTLPEQAGESFQTKGSPPASSALHADDGSLRLSPMPVPRQVSLPDSGPVSMIITAPTPSPSPPRTQGRR